MKFRIKTDITYQVYDKAVKAVVTVLEVPEHIKKMAACYYNLNDEHLPKIKLPMSYSGTAVYKEGDKFDIELAKTIARKKAQRAMYSNYFAYVREITKRMANIFGRWEAYQGDIAAKRNVVDEYLKSGKED